MKCNETIDAFTHGEGANKLKEQNKKEKTTTKVHAKYWRFGGTRTRIRTNRSQNEQPTVQQKKRRILYRWIS